MAKFTKSSTGTHLRVSVYKGVSWNTVAQKWKSTVTHQKVIYDCGFYSNDRDAAKARDMKIIALGLNKPLQILKRV